MRRSPRTCAARCGGSSAKANRTTRSRRFLSSRYGEFVLYRPRLSANDIGACGPVRSCSWRSAVSCSGAFLRPGAISRSTRTGRRDRNVLDRRGSVLCAVAVVILLVPVWRMRRGGGPWSLVGHRRRSVASHRSRSRLYFVRQQLGSRVRRTREPRDGPRRAARAAISRATRTISKVGGCWRRATYSSAATSMAARRTNGSGR